MARAAIDREGGGGCIYRIDLKMGIEDAVSADSWLGPRGQES